MQSSRWCSKASSGRAHSSSSSCRALPRGRNKKPRRRRCSPPQSTDHKTIMTGLEAGEKGGWIQHRSKARQSKEGRAKARAEQSKAGCLTRPWQNRTKKTGTGLSVRACGRCVVVVWLVAWPRPPAASRVHGPISSTSGFAPPPSCSERICRGAGSVVGQSTTKGCLRTCEVRRRHLNSPHICGHGVVL